MTNHYKSLQSVTGIRDAVWKLRRGGFDSREASDIVVAIAELYKVNTVDALACVEEIYSSSDEQSLSSRIRDYVDGTQGYFNVTGCDKELQIVTPQNKANRRQIFFRLVKDKVLERHTVKDGLYRRVEYDSPVIEWETADISDVFKISWPFELENYALMYPKNIAVIAGSPNAGKTAFLLNLIKLNMANHIIHYYSSEMGPEELKLRLSKFANTDKWVFDARERSMNFADVIYPDDINIIDYIEIVSGEFFKIAEELRAIFDKLNKGIAVIALQKKRGAELGRGAEFSLEKPRLYLSMDSGSLKIIKAKNWAVEGQNPNDVEFKFSLVNGAKFVY